MVGFGGAGPAHAAGVARALGVTELLVPPASGAASALGFLAAPLSFEQVRSHPVRLDLPGAAAAIAAVLAELEKGEQSGTLARLSDDLPLFAAAARPAATKPAESAIETALADTDPDNMTPREALKYLYRLRGMLAKA